MKFRSLVSALVMGITVVACAQQPKVPESAKAFVPSKAEVDSVSYLLGVNYGTFIKSYGFGDVNYSELLSGIKDFVNAKGDQRDSNFVKQFKINPETINTLFNSYLEKMNNMKMAVNQAAADEFLAENLKKEGVAVTPSGLQYKIVKPGSDVKATIDDAVKVNYKGTLLDGTVFDETVGNPVEFELRRVIAGFQEGLQLVGEGGEIILFVPPHLGYGENGSQAIEPNSLLTFDVELVGVNKAEAETEAVAE